MNGKDSKNTQKATKFESSFIFKFRTVELKFAAKIVVCCQLRNLFNTELNKANFDFLKALEIFLIYNKTIIEFGFCMI